MSKHLGLAAFYFYCAVSSAALGHETGTPDTRIYDGYQWGIHTSRLEVNPDGVSLSRKDLATNQWNPPVSASGDLSDKNADFHLAGAIKRFPAHLASIAEASWKSNNAVGWPGPDSVYVRARTLSASVRGEPAEANYWAARDTSNPMDLVIGPDDLIIAAIDVSNDQVIVLRGYEAFTLVKQWRDPLVSQPLHGYRELEQAMVPTRSGARLATRVVLPDGDVEGPFPTVFVRTPYGISDGLERFRQYALRGYAVVLQAVRGTIYWDEAGRSEGSWGFTPQEPGDGADALDWIVSQPWSDGSVCMQGGSYVGFTQWALTMSNHPALKCVVPEVSMGTAFSDQPYMGGTFVQGLAFYLFWMTDNPLLPGRSWTDVMNHRPLIEMDEYATGVDIPIWNSTLEHWRNDDYWKPQNWYAGSHPRDVATLQISGWFDDDYPGTRSNWALVERFGSRPNRLLLGPWKHGYNVDRQLNGYRLGNAALREDIWLLKQKWYDFHLKGLENGVDRPRVEYFVLGENRWRTADEWPPREAQARAYYLHSTGKANRHTGDGQLSIEAPQHEQAAERFEYDPSDPVRNWYSFDLMQSWADVQSFPYDFKDIETRQDVAIYTSSVLEQDLTIAGNIRVVLFASTDVRDTDWWAYVSDVAPDNSSNRLSVGVIRARFRHLEDPDYHVFGKNFESERLLSGDIGEVVRYEISIPSIANTFKKGHRVRLAIMNAHSGYSFPNSNTGRHEAYVTESTVGKMVIHHSPAFPSHVLLPVLEDLDERAGGLD